MLYANTCISVKLNYAAGLIILSIYKFGLMCEVFSVHITVDREIFALKIIRVKSFRVDKFSRFRSIREIFLTVDDCNMDKRLESL